MGLIFTILEKIISLFAGDWITKRRQSRADSEARVLRVSETYMDFRRSSRTSGLDGLLKAGIATLASNDEIEQLLSRIVAHGEKHPLRTDHQAKLKDVDLLRFFRHAAEKRVNFFHTDIEDVIRDSGARCDSPN